MHAIEVFDDGSAAFFAARKPGWHRLGTVTEEALTAEEALETAKLDWEVEKTPLFAKIGGKWVQVPRGTNHATYRTDRNEILGTVGNIYTPTQNLEAFTMLDSLIEAKGGAHYETAGSLFGGRHVFLSVKMPVDLTIGDDDEVEFYIVADNSHDGSSPFRIAVVTLRPACWNTLTAGLRSARRMWTARHTSSLTGRVEEARETLELATKYIDEFGATAEKLVNESFSDDEFEKLTEEIFPINKNTSTVTENRHMEFRSAVTDIWSESPTVEKVANTKWAAFNAVQEFDEWFKPVRVKEGEDEFVKRAERSLEGDTQLADKAFALLTK